MTREEDAGKAVLAFHIAKRTLLANLPPEQAAVVRLGGEVPRGEWRLWLHLVRKGSDDCYACQLVHRGGERRSLGTFDRSAGIALRNYAKTIGISWVGAPRKPQGREK